MTDKPMTPAEQNKVLREALKQCYRALSSKWSPYIRASDEDAAAMKAARAALALPVVDESARIAELERERDELRAREKACETIREAEMVALVRMAQGLCPMLGLDPLTASPSEIVAAAEALHAQHALVAEFVRDIGRAHGIQGKEG